MTPKKFSILDLNMRQLIDVLKTLKNGAIGFDVFRNPETNTKGKLLTYIATQFPDDAVILAVNSVMGQSDAPTVTATEALKRLEEKREEMTKPFKEPYTFFDEISIIDETIKQAEAITEKPKKQKPASTDDTTEKLGQQIAALIAAAQPKAPSLDEAKINQMIGAALFEYESTLREIVVSEVEKTERPTHVVVEHKATGEMKDLGVQHKCFPTLLKMAQARTRDGNRLNIWLKGPAGSGKTTAAKKVAEALNMPFQFNGAISTEYELMGFRDAGGHYHTTAFREVFENGGVYLFDEVDSSLPKAVLAFNAALANGECRFPDKMVLRHPDCVVLAGANTAGNGASSDYVGRMKQDLAFLNRFVMLDWPLDEKLEKALSGNKDWVLKVQKYRKNAEKRSIKGHIISPRATIFGEALLSVGLDEEIVEQAVLRGALSTEQWESLCQ